MTSPGSARLGSPADPVNGYSIEDRFSMRTAAGTGKLGGRTRRRLAIDENVHSTPIVGKHSVPAFVVRAIPKTFSPLWSRPPFQRSDHHAFVEFKGDAAGRAGRPVGQWSIHQARNPAPCFPDSQRKGRPSAAPHACGEMLEPRSREPYALRANRTNEFSLSNRCCIWIPPDSEPAVGDPPFKGLMNSRLFLTSVLFPRPMSPYRRRA